MRLNGKPLNNLLFVNLQSTLRKAGVKGQGMASLPTATEEADATSSTESKEMDAVGS